MNDGQITTVDGFSPDLKLELVNLGEAELHPRRKSLERDADRN
jgi:hypothetical protein